MVLLSASVIYLFNKKFENVVFSGENFLCSTLMTDMRRLFMSVFGPENPSTTTTALWL